MVIGEFLIEAGDGILMPLLDILNAAKKSTKHPTQWKDVCITIIYNNKWTREMLQNYRGIFHANIVSKIFECP